MSIDSREIAASLKTLRKIEPAFHRAVKKVGLPKPWPSARGHAALLRTIVGQQVSMAAARAIFGRLETLVGKADDPRSILRQSDEDLRAVGLSRQKVAHARSLATLVASGEVDLDNLPPDDEAAVAMLMEIKGVGRWTAEIYLLVAEARPDIWPAGDLGVRIGTGMILGLPDHPDEKAARALATPWRPHRSAAALMTWHYYHSP